MKYKITINTHDGFMSRVYVDKYRSLGDAAFGGMRKDQYSEAGHDRSAKRATIEVEAAMCDKPHPVEPGINCTQEDGHRGTCYAWDAARREALRWRGSKVITL